MVAAAEIEPMLLTVNDVAKLWAVSTRHVCRMADGELMPRLFELDNLNR